MKVERVVLNALTENAALPPASCAFGDLVGIVCGEPIHLRLGSECVLSTR